MRTDPRGGLALTQRSVMDKHSVLRTEPVEDVVAQMEGPDGDGDGGSADRQWVDHEPQQQRLRRRLGPVDLMGFGIGIVIGIGTSPSSMAVPILRRTRPNLPRPFRVKFSPVIPVLSALACLYLMTNLSMETWLRFLAWMVLGLLVYLFYGRRNARLATRGEAASASPAPAREEGARRNG